MLSWQRPHGPAHTVFWFQVSRDGWDAWAGSKFTMEFQVSELPVVGEVSSYRKRLGDFLDDETREEARTIQNQIIASLAAPPPDHFLLEDQRLRKWYLAKFKPDARRYSKRDDIWFRYHEPAHLALWGRFILKRLPECIQEMETATSAAPTPASDRGRRPWWRFW